MTRRLTTILLLSAALVGCEAPRNDDAVAPTRQDTHAQRTQEKASPGAASFDDLCDALSKHDRLRGVVLYPMETELEMVETVGGLLYADRAQGVTVDPVIGRRYRHRFVDGHAVTLRSGAVETRRELTMLAPLLEDLWNGCGQLQVRPFDATDNPDLPLAGRNRVQVRLAPGVTAFIGFGRTIGYADLWLEALGERHHVQIVKLEFVDELPQSLDDDFEFNTTTLQDHAWWTKEVYGDRTH